jgi:hypothetical protein
VPTFVFATRSPGPGMGFASIKIKKNSKKIKKTLHSLWAFCILKP